MLFSRISLSKIKVAPWFNAVADWSIWLVPIALCSLATFHDMRRREIPDWIPLAILIATLVVWSSGVSGFALSHHLAGGVIATVFALVVGRGDRFGGGDVKLFGALGAWFGLFAVFPLALWIAIAGLPLAIVAAIRKQTDFAYAPAIFAGVCVHCASPDLIQRIML